MDKYKHLFLTLGFLVLLFGCMKYGGQVLWPAQTFNESDNNMGGAKVIESPHFPAFSKLPTDRKEKVLMQTYNKPKEIQNLILMTHVLFEYSVESKTFNDLLSYLKNSGQSPVIFDPSYRTGSGLHHKEKFYTIRTKSPLQGTRYFHAQYESDKSSEPFMQHMSFEFRPGPKAMAEAEDALKLAYSELGTPYINESNLKAWKLPNGLHAYIKKLELVDITDHPFNSYKKEDVGAIQLAIELDVHGSDDGHEH